MLRDAPSHAFVEQAIVAAVERTNAADEACIVEEHDYERQPDQNERQRQLPPRQRTRRSEHRGKRRADASPGSNSRRSWMLGVGSKLIASGVAIETPKIMRPTSLRFDRPAGELGVAPGRKLPVRRPATALRPASTAGCRRNAAGKRYITKYGMVSCQGCSTLPQAPLAPAALRCRLCRSSCS